MEPQVLSNDDLRRLAPSVFATHAHERTKPSYQFFPTINVVDGLRQAGFVPVSAQQTRCRDEGQRAYTKHAIRFRHPDAVGANSVGEYIPEVVLLNSHNGTSSYQLWAGIYRVVCSNGMVAGESLTGLRIRHSHKLVDEVIEGSFKVIGQTELLAGAVERMKAVQLSQHERLDFAHKALLLRYHGHTYPMMPVEALRLHREADTKFDLWTTFNVVQENIMRGGMKYRTQRHRNVATRPVKSVNEDIRVNQGLWDLAESYFQRDQPLAETVSFREVEVVQ